MWRKGPDSDPIFLIPVWVGDLSPGVSYDGQQLCQNVRPYQAFLTRMGLINTSVVTWSELTSTGSPRHLLSVEEMWRADLACINCNDFSILLSIWRHIVNFPFVGWWWVLKLAPLISYHRLQNESTGPCYSLRAPAASSVKSEGMEIFGDGEALSSGYCTRDSGGIRGSGRHLL